MVVVNKWINQTEIVGDIKRHHAEQSHLLTSPPLQDDFSYKPFQL